MQLQSTAQAAQRNSAAVHTKSAAVDKFPGLSPKPVNSEPLNLNLQTPKHLL